MKTRFFLSFLALVFAFGVLGISLMDAKTVNGQRASSDHQLYFDKTMLPDHLFYPLFMVVDRVELMKTPEDQKSVVEIAYANRRLVYAEELLDLKKEDLAVSTITKAEKYLYDANQELLAHQQQPRTKEYLIRALQYHIKRLQILKMNLTDANRSVVDHSLIEDQTLLQDLQ